MVRFGFPLLLATLLAVISMPLWADKQYGLTPRLIAEQTYFLQGRNEHFNFRNGGNIVNTAFIVTAEGVVVIDTGPSRLYGEQLRAAIGKITDLPIVMVVNTHLHPDHFLGNQAFEDIGVSALGGTIEAIKLQGELFNDNMYRLAGAWMKGTRVVVPIRRIMPNQVEQIGGHRLNFFALKGHSGTDLVVLDERTGVLFAGDLVFHDRTPTTPHADIAHWLAALEQVRNLDFKTLVPGHGAVVNDDSSIAQTRGYLQWLDESLKRDAEAGRSMAEVLRPDAPPGLTRRLAVFADEYQRSVAHLYPQIEASVIARGRVVEQE